MKKVLKKKDSPVLVNYKNRTQDFSFLDEETFKEHPGLHASFRAFLGSNAYGGKAEIISIMGAGDKDSDVKIMRPGLIYGENARKLSSIYDQRVIPYLYGQGKGATKRTPADIKNAINKAASENKLFVMFEIEELGGHRGKEAQRFVLPVTRDGYKFAK